MRKFARGLRTSGGGMLDLRRLRSPRPRCRRVATVSDGLPPPSEWACLEPGCADDGGCPSPPAAEHRPRPPLHPQASSLHPSSFIPHPSSLIPHPSSLIPHPSSLIPHPSSLIPHPSSLIPHPSSLIPHRSSLLPPPSSLLPSPIRAGSRSPLRIEEHQRASGVTIALRRLPSMWTARSCSAVQPPSA